MNVLVATEAIQKEVERLQKIGQLPYVTSVKSSHPGEDIKASKNRLVDGVLYVYASGSSIEDVAGRGKVVRAKTGTALTFCVQMKSANNTQAIRKVGETVYSIISNMAGMTIPSAREERISNIEVDKQTRELYQDGFYFYSIRLLTDIHIAKGA